MFTRLSVLGLALLILGSLSLHAASPTSEGKTIRSLGVKYIVRVRNEDGSYGLQDEFIAGRTALAVYSLSSSQRTYRYTDGPFLSDPIDFLLAKQNDDGSFGSGNDVVWQTLAAAKAFEAQDNKRFAKALAAAKAYYENASGKAYPVKEAEFFSALFDAVGQTGPFAKKVIELTTRIETNASGTAEYMQSLVEEAGGQQVRADDTAKEYGSYPTTAEDKLEKDPVIATALAVVIGDRIKDNWKKFQAK